MLVYHIFHRKTACDLLWGMVSNAFDRSSIIACTCPLLFRVDAKSCVVDIVFHKSAAYRDHVVDYIYDAVVVNISACWWTLHVTYYKENGL